MLSEQERIEKFKIVKDIVNTVLQPYTVFLKHFGEDERLVTGISTSAIVSIYAQALKSITDSEHRDHLINSIRQSLDDLNNGKEPSGYYNGQTYKVKTND